MRANRLTIWILCALWGATTFAGPRPRPDGKNQEATDSPQLAIGSPAPPLDIEHWFGDPPLDGPIDKFQPGQVYVVEFWATWCAPCVVSMPHLAKLQNAYKDQGLWIISVSDESEPTVREFLDRPLPADEDRTFADLARVYHITTDPDLSVHRAYMAAAGEAAIPIAFIVGKSGHIEWIGGPMQLDEPLEQVMSDQWDRQRFAKQAELERATDQVIQQSRNLAARADEIEAVRNLGAMLRKVDDPVTVYRLAGRIQALSDRDSAYDAEMLSLASEKMRTAVDQVPDEFRSHLYDVLARILHLRGETRQAIDVQTKAVEGASPELKRRFDSFLQDLRAAEEAATITTE